MEKTAVRFWIAVCLLVARQTAALSSTATTEQTVAPTVLSSLPATTTRQSYLPILTRPTKIPSQLASLDWYHPTYVAINPHNEHVYIINGFGNVYVSLTRGLERIANTQVDGFRISAYVLDAENDLFYVGTVVEVNQAPLNQVSIVQADQLIGEIDIPSHSVYDMVVDTHTNLVYLAGADPPHITGGEIAGYIYVLDRDVIVKTIELGNHVPRHLHFDAENSLLYVGGYRKNDDPDNTTMGTIDIIRDLQLINQLEIGKNVRGFIPNQQNSDLYVDLRPLYLNHEDQDSLAILRNGNVIASTFIEQYNGTDKMVHPHTNELYVSWPGLVWVYQRQADNSFLLEREFSVEPSSYLRAIDPVSGNLYFVRFYHNETVVYHDAELLATFPGGYPWQLGVNPNNGWVYVSNTEGNTVSVLGYEE